MNEAFQMLWPIALIVFSNVFYHVCSKSTPDTVSPFASLTVTYFIGAVISAVLFFLLERSDGGLVAEYRKLNWTTYVLGIAIVGLEAGNIYMYKAGWYISAGQLVQSSILAICLIFVGALFYREHITFTKVAGIVVCMAGLYLINRG